ncbi:MAG: sigma-70 family RNA polymerase sigma factor [Candidatus Krumholzibacteria bacterium]|nr:sigma-70 family RNA polymerase sigma factor [Candidatus Krumholzibacteria bacterium]
MTDVKDGDEGLMRPAELPQRKIDFGGLTDEELMLLVQEGRNQAFDVLVGRYKNRLFTYLCRLLGNQDEAEEFAQEAFVKAYIHADKYRTIARFSTWLYTIATNLVRNRVRNVKRRPAVVSMWSEDSSGEDAGKWMEIRDDSNRPDFEAERRNLNEMVQEAIEKIPGKYRPAFVLREMDDLSYEEIAAVTGLKLGTVRSRINRGRAHFRRTVAPFMEKDHDTKRNRT